MLFRSAKPELERLAGGLHVEDGPELTKQRLVAAIVEAGGVRLNDLTKAELQRLARGRGATVRASMTKHELMAEVAGAVPAGR